MMNSTKMQEDIKYSRFFSSLLCSTSIIAFSILSLLNNLALDIYTAADLLKIVVPASFCFWFLGFTIGKIFDSLNKKMIIEKTESEKEAYEMPSIFVATDDIIEKDEFGAL